MVSGGHGFSYRHRVPTSPSLLFPCAYILKVLVVYTRDSPSVTHSPNLSSALCIHLSESFTLSFCNGHSRTTTLRSAPDLVVCEHISTPLESRSRGRSSPQSPTKASSLFFGSLAHSFSRTTDLRRISIVGPSLTSSHALRHTFLEDALRNHTRDACLHPHSFSLRARHYTI